VGETLGTALQNGDLPVVKYMVSLQYVVLAPHDANCAAFHRQLELVKYFISVGIYPTHDAPNVAAGNGDIKMLKYLASLHPPVLPNQWGTNLAAENGDIKMLKYMVSKGVYPTSESADRAAGNGDIKMLKFLISLGIHPTSESADNAAENGHIEMMKFLVEELGIRPDEKSDYGGANTAAQNGHLNMVEYLESLIPPIRPDKYGFDLAAGNGYIEMLIHLTDLDPYTYRPDKYTLHHAVCGGHLTTVKYVMQNRTIRPNDIHIFVALEHVNIVKYFHSKGVVFNRRYAGQALLQSIQTVQFLASLGILPDQEDINTAAGCGCIEGVKYLSTLNPPCLPDQEGVNRAAEEAKFKVVDFLASFDIFPTPEAMDAGYKRAKYLDR
jgi:hypothetical protein